MNKAKRRDSPGLLRSRELSSERAHREHMVTCAADDNMENLFRSLFSTTLLLLHYYQHRYRYRLQLLLRFYLLHGNASNIIIIITVSRKRCDISIKNHRAVKRQDTGNNKWNP